MGKDSNIAPDFKVPIRNIPEDEKEVDPSDGKPPSFKLLLDAKGEVIGNPTLQVQRSLMAVPRNNSLSGIKVSVL
jgi:hypothetical protein